MKIGPLSIDPWPSWKIMLFQGRNWFNDNKRFPLFFGIFKNTGINGTRWGFYWYGVEFGSRNPESRFGAFLKRWYLWPW